MIKRILALLLLAALFAAPAWADTTTVSSTADLEGALANELFDTINIAPGTYSGRFTITRPVKLIGDGSSKPILDGGAPGIPPPHPPDAHRRQMTVIPPASSIRMRVAFYSKSGIAARRGS